MPGGKGRPPISFCVSSWTRGVFPFASLCAATIRSSNISASSGLASVGSIRNRRISPLPDMDLHQTGVLHHLAEVFHRLILIVFKFVVEFFAGPASGISPARVELLLRSALGQRGARREIGLHGGAQPLIFGPGLIGRAVASPSSAGFVSTQRCRSTRSEKETLITKSRPALPACGRRRSADSPARPSR